LADRSLQLKIDCGIARTRHDVVENRDMFSPGCARIWSAHVHVRKQELEEMSSDDLLANQRTIIANQETIIANQHKIEANQAKLDEALRNQATIVANQQAILSNQGKLDSIMSNQEQILGNQKAILAKLQ
jgi:hypothetical protein